MLRNFALHVDHLHSLLYEARKEPLCHGVDGVGGRFVTDLRLTSGDIEAYKVFHRGQVRSLNTPSQAELPGHCFVGRREATLGSVSLQLGKVPSSAAGQQQDRSEDGKDEEEGDFLHHVALEGRVLILLCLRDVLLLPADLVLLFVCSPLVAVGVGPGQQLVSTERLSTHPGEGRGGGGMAGT